MRIILWEGFFERSITGDIQEGIEIDRATGVYRFARFQQRDDENGHSLRGGVAAFAAG